MKAVVFTVFLTLLPAAALADCVTAADLATGVLFKRQDGRAELASGAGAEVAINYAATSQTAWTDKRTTQRGLYEQSWVWTPTDDYYVGGGPGASYDYRLSGQPPLPVAGQTWQARVSVKTHTDDGTENGARTQRSAMDVTYRFLAETTAKLSGCTYKIMPVEADFTAKNTSFTKRWIYFPDLGFGLETRVSNHLTGEDRKLGLTALTPKG